ncbi:MAG: PleD family two-component response regulator [Rhodothermales bacterium]|jgi:PleD family two-component response regulator
MDSLVQLSLADRELISVLLIDEDVKLQHRVQTALQEFQAPAFHVVSASDLLEAARQLDLCNVDIIVTELALPSCSGISALNRVMQMASSIPVLVFSAVEEEAVSMAAIGAGAQDVVCKASWTRNGLRRAILHAFARHYADDERHRLQEQLTETQHRLVELEGLLSVCSYCNRIRNDRGHWESMEAYVSTHSRASISHGMCPNCFDKVSAEFAHAGRNATRDAD